MKTKFEFPDSGDNIVYVRPVAVDSLPAELQDQANGAGIVYSVHRSDGEPVALVANRMLAFRLARENDMTAVNAH